MKDNNENFENKWSIVDRAKTFNTVSKKGRLCMKEKCYIHAGAELGQAHLSTWIWVYYD